MEREEESRSGREKRKKFGENKERERKKLRERS
jgi:hypothetical protein